MKERHEEPQIRLNRLADMKPGSPEALRALVENLDTIAHAAVTLEKSYTNKAGRSVTVGSPDFPSAIKSLNLQAQLMALFDAQPRAESGDGDLIDVKIEYLNGLLKRMGMQIVPLEAPADGEAPDKQ